MLRRVLTAIVLLACTLCLRAQEGANVYDSLRSWLQAVSTMPVDSINARCDALIAAAPDDEVRAKIAGVAFDYFMQSPVMGVEGVSVYIADNYFLNKRLRWPSEESFPNVYAFAEFNRLSLLGMQAQPLTLESLEGDMVDVRQATGGAKILYFYEDKCATCARQTPLLAALLKEYCGTTPLTLYAVYTQGDRSAWAKYAFANFHGIDNPKVVVHNLWDPQGASEFHKKYSVLSTPSLLLLDADNRIVGRKLDVDALSQLLEQKESFTASLYSLMDDIRDNMGLDTLAMADVCKSFDERLAGDEPLYRETFLGIYNYLRGQGDYEALLSAAFVAENYILARPDIWSKELYAQTAEALRRFRLNPVGSKAADVTLKTRHGRSRSLLGYSGKKYAVLFFHLVSCSDCAAWREQLLKMKKLLKKSGAKVTAVYVGPDRDEWVKSPRGAGCFWRELAAEWPSSELYDKYDVGTVPKIYLLDKNGTILAKDISPESLKEILEQ